MSKQVLMEEIVSLCKRRGFIYQGSEIYGGLAGTWDYGPLGISLKRNVANLWWKRFVDDRPDIYGVDAAILMNPRVWEASGHVDGFNDPLVEDRKTKKRYRADHLLEANDVKNTDDLTIEEMNKKIKDLGIKSPDGNELGEVKQFNMMLSTQIGASEDSSTKTYLRPETAQGIFTNYKNTIDSFHPSLPFGIAQIGKAFRNEITPRDFIFRVRELEQMEIQYFIHSDNQKETFEAWKKHAWEWLSFLGLSEENMQWHEHGEKERAHYAAAAVDIQYRFPFGFKELHGIHNRTDYDLSNHQKASGVSLEYFDEASGEKFVPYVIESSVGVDRTLLSLLAEAYTEEEVEGETRIVLKFKPHIAPVKVAVLPLMRKDELKDVAKEVFDELKGEFVCMYDETASIGKRYRRQDEIGTPFAVTVDYDTLEDESVTVRDRDSMEQERVKIEELTSYFSDKFSI